METAEEFLDEKAETHWSGYHLCSIIKTYEARELMIEFAKMHVQEALRQADEDLSLRYEYDSDLILNAYPLENIK